MDVAGATIVAAGAGGAAVCAGRALAVGAAMVVGACVGIVGVVVAPSRIIVAGARRARLARKLAWAWLAV